MDYKAVEAKWQAYWEKTGLARFDLNAGGEKPESVAVNGKTCGPDCIGRDKPAIILDPTLDEWDIEAAFM